MGKFYSQTHLGFKKYVVLVLTENHFNVRIFNEMFCKLDFMSDQLVWMSSELTLVIP